MSEQKQRVYDALNKLGIKYEVVEHEPVHTMEDMDRLGLPEKGTLCKNLFLRDAKGKRHFLITCDENAKVDLKSLGRQLGAGNLSFASEERLEKYLGLKQGSVSPFGLTRAIDAKPDDYLSITQVVDENGSEQDIISTGLLIVDEHQQRVAITDIVSNTGQLSQYSIYATMKVSVTNDRQALKVRINWFETTLNYGTSMKASSLMQTSKYSPEVGFQYDDITKTISNPAGGTPYHYTPNNTQMITYSTLECGRSCRSYIKAGTSSLNIAYCVISSAPGGRWERA